MTTAVAVIEGPGTALAHTAPRLALLRPIAPVADVLVAQNEMRDLIAQTLQKGRDFGVVPGTDKPTLFKPGAERVNAALGLAPRFRIVESEVDHDREVPWIKRRKIYEGPKGARRFVRDEETRGTSLGLYRYVVECELVHRESGQVVAACVGSCSTMESKYIDRPRDCENTTIKMAGKRAYVGATLLAAGLSDQFTQDVEDMPREMFGAADAEEGATEPRVANGVIEQEAACPKCGGKMWDNRATKTNPKAPDFKCRNKDNCDGVWWPGQWPPKTEADKEAERQSAVSERRAKVLPASFPVKTLRGRAVGDLSRDEVVAALGAARKHGAQKWADLFTEEIEERNARAQSELPMGSAPSEPGASKQVDMPPGGRVEDAFAHATATSGAIDDEIPF